MLFKWCVMIVLGLVFALSVTAQETTPAAPPVPVLSESQKKDITIAIQQVQLLDLQTQLARVALQKLIASVTPQGYTLREDLTLAPVLKPSGP